MIVRGNERCGNTEAVAGALERKIGGLCALNYGVDLKNSLARVFGGLGHNPLAEKMLPRCDPPMTKNTRIGSYPASRQLYKTTVQHLPKFAFSRWFR
jgi:hypothetical protein